MSKIDNGYPSFIMVLLEMIKKTFYQSGLLGLILTVALVPYYQSFVSLLQSYHISNQLIFTAIMMISHTGTFITVALYYIYIDHYQYYQQYKMIRKSSQSLSKKLIIKTVIELIINHFITSPVMAYFMYNTFRNSFGMLNIDDALPTYDIIFRDYVRAHIFNDVGFYFTHRLLHHPYIYASFHKQHHDYHGTISIAAEYANPVESLLSNVIPSLGGVLCFGCHPLVVVVW